MTPPHNICGCYGSMITIIHRATPYKNVSAQCHFSFSPLCVVFNMHVYVHIYIEIRPAVVYHCIAANDVPFIMGYDKMAAINKKKHASANQVSQKKSQGVTKPVGGA